MNEFKTLGEMFDAQQHSAKSIRFVNGADDETVVSFRDLRSRALDFLGALQARGMTPGDELIIHSASNERFLIAFWAAILGGILPVPVAIGISDEHRLKLFRIAGQLKKPRLFTDSNVQERLSAFASNLNISGASDLLGSDCFTVVEDKNGNQGDIHSGASDDLAFVQYSSGSTSDPKGVCLTHRNLISTMRGMVKALEATADDIGLSWMPLTHDLGLIGYHLSLVSIDVAHVIMDTSLFVRRPLLWMTKASETRATMLCSPNFGYKHYLKMFERKPPDGMDLSCVRLVSNGAEPISLALCDEFLQAMAPYGLNSTVISPSYGLAEATLGVSFAEVGRELGYIIVKRHSLRIGAPYELADAGDSDAVTFVKNGKSIDGCEVQFADDDDVVLADGCVGNIQIRGENITQGLYRDPENTRLIFTSDGWLRTGDCGVLVDGEIVITGRAKDIIIVNGQNYYPHDIEEIVAGLDELELGKVVVSGAKRPGTRVEELLVFVLHRQDLDSFSDLASKVHDIVGKQAGLEVGHVIPVARIPKTTSGKVQRAKLIEEYLDGSFDTALKDLKNLAIPVNDEGPEADEDPLVADLLAICAEFSKDRHIGADDNLFEVGISSLTLTEIMLAVEEKHPGKIDINDLFDHPTIRELAAFLAAKS
jgi:acyl-CoA synthetase (AMP-forming)/AMP-acid ligase II/acyl carrier protein